MQSHLQPQPILYILLSTGGQEFNGATVRFGDVLDLNSIRSVAFQDKVDVVVSCLASRTGDSCLMRVSCVNGQGYVVTG